ncbi:MAG: hypothetical protein ACKVP7_07215 [Hyphomicrobiaceae bacterium]
MWARGAMPVAVAWLAALFLLLSQGQAQDKPRGGWMSAEAIRQEFTDRLLNGIYPSTMPWSEHLFRDGSTDYREGDKRWKGRWWTEDRAFCFAYPPPGVGGCFRVVRLGVNCYELYETGAAAGRGDGRPDDVQAWNGRMWVADKKATCDEQPTS